MYDIKKQELIITSAPAFFYLACSKKIISTAARFSEIYIALALIEHAYHNSIVNGIPTIIITANKNGNIFTAILDTIPTSTKSFME